MTVAQKKNPAIKFLSLRKDVKSYSDIRFIKLIGWSILINFL